MCTAGNVMSELLVTTPDNHRDFGTLQSARSLEPATTVYSTEEEDEVFCPSLVTEDYSEYPASRHLGLEVTGRLPPYYKSW